MKARRQQIRFCRTDDATRIAYAVTGRGPILMKAANWLSHLEFDFESPIWRHMLDALSRHHSLVRYDERGCGLSDWNVPLSFEAWLDDFERVVDSTGLTRFPLLGISQGASIAVAYACKYPERVSHLILYGGYARGMLRRYPTPEQVKEAEAVIKLAEAGWGQSNPAIRQFFTTKFFPSGTYEQHQWFNELARISTSPANAARFLTVFHQIDVTDLLPQVRCPTLVMHATRDACVPFDEGRLLASMIPGARFVPLESDNHLLLEHEPAWQRWVEEVDAFLPCPANTPDARFTGLTGREREITELIAQGRDNAQIASVLGLSEKTIRNNITNIFLKLEVENRSQAIVLARQSGFGGQERVPR